MTSLEKQESRTQTRPQTSPADSNKDKPGLDEPDLEFIRSLTGQGAESLKKCFQCGTCSATCSLSPDTAPFPRKEMAWAVWGLKRRLVNDPDVWLCYQCQDCSTKCPRGARPGDVLGAIRQQSVLHYAIPPFMGRWANEASGIPLLLGVPALVLTLALCLKEPMAKMLGISASMGERIVYPYSTAFPHWLLNSVFGVLALLIVIVVTVGVVRFWHDMKATNTRRGDTTPAKGLWSSILAVLKGIVTHERFGECEKTRLRFWSHTCVFYGFLALCLVTFWVITARINPLINRDFVYPFAFFDPWKMLANAGGIAILAGCALMIFDRVRDSERTGTGGLGDWTLITLLLVVVVSGFAAEVLHYLRLEPHRHIAYFMHLVFVFALLMSLPYSKLAHIFYRTTALVYAEHTGRNGGLPSGTETTSTETTSTETTSTEATSTEEEETDHAKEGSE